MGADGEETDLKDIQKVELTGLRKDRVRHREGKDVKAFG